MNKGNYSSTDDWNIQQQHLSKTILKLERLEIHPKNEDKNQTTSEKVIQKKTSSLQWHKMKEINDRKFFHKRSPY